MCFSPNASNAAGEAKIGDLVLNVVTAILLDNALEKYIFRLDVSVDEVFFVDALEPLHDLHSDLEGVVEGEALAREAGLIC